MLRAGQFLFEGLWAHDIFFVNFLVDQAGKLYGTDFRLWRPLNLTTLDPRHWPPRPTLHAAGPLGFSHGFHEGHTAWTLTQFLHALPVDHGPMIIWPLDSL